MRWATSKAPRDQLLLIPTRLDDVVSQDHPIRIVNELLNSLDWRLWEQEYNGQRGQPPIHPRLLAGSILYGMTRRGIRSSRDLEEATKERVDFMWFLEGRTIDHSTFAAFRTRFSSQLEDLFKGISRQVVEQNKYEVFELVVDGTRIRSSSNRTGAKTQDRLEKTIASYEKRLNEILNEIAMNDERSNSNTTELEVEKAQLIHRKEQATAALDVAKERDAVKQQKSGPKSKAVRVPVTDTDSLVLPNKEGGFAPNYTPVIGVEVNSGAIVSAEIATGDSESAELSPAIDNATEVCGQQPKHVMADSHFFSENNVKEMSERNIEGYIPIGKQCDAQLIQRKKLSSPVNQESIDKLPRTGKKFDRCCFIYSSEADVYYCPMGKELVLYRKETTRSNGINAAVYRCRDCHSCPQRSQCVKSKTGLRTILRSECEPLIQQVRERMASEEGKEVYKRRAPSVEGTFGCIKYNMGIRQFYYRKRKKVKCEWLWICSAFNLKKYLKKVAGEMSSDTSRHQHYTTTALSSYQGDSICQWNVLHDERHLEVAA